MGAAVATCGSHPWEETESPCNIRPRRQWSWLPGTGGCSLVPGRSAVQTAGKCIVSIVLYFSCSLLTSKAGLKCVRSSELAPILIRGGIPVIFRTFSKELKKKLFLDVEPTQSSHLSCSKEKETWSPAMRAALAGVVRGIAMVMPCTTSAGTATRRAMWVNKVSMMITGRTTEPGPGVGVYLYRLSF